MQLCQKIAILEFEKAYTKIHTNFGSEFPCGFELQDFRTKSPVRLDGVYLSHVLKLDFQELYESEEVLENCRLLSKEKREELGFGWWSLGDSLGELVYDFCRSDKKINEYNIHWLEVQIKKMYESYLWLVETELPPPIPGDCDD